LPEAQLDRFLLRISVGYPDRDAEISVLSSHRLGEPVDELQPVLTESNVIELQQAVRNVRMEDAIYEYILDIVHATRKSDELLVGASIRAALALARGAQARALIEGRDYVVPDDVKQLAVPVLSHRVISKGYSHGGQREAVEALLGRLVAGVPVPS
jgi:MoxR-like ATPase